MPTLYNSYVNISPKYIDIFESLWEQYYEKLPTITTQIQNESNVKASLFNIWVNYYKTNQFFLIKSEKQFLHAFDENLIKKIDLVMQHSENIRMLFERFEKNKEFIFVFSYLMTLEIFRELDLFVPNHPILKKINIKQYHYYYLTDDDITEKHELFLIVKVLNSEFLNEYLTNEKLKSIFTKIYFWFNNNLEF
jgi:hypothetical protein